MDASEFVEPRLYMLRSLPLMHRLLRMIFIGEKARMTKTQFYILITLSVIPSLTMTEIAEHIGASKEQATRAVAPLVDGGMVQRTVMPCNRTRVYVSLTETGQKYIREMIARCSERLDERMTERLTPEEQSALQMHLAESAALLETIVSH